MEKKAITQQEKTAREKRAEEKVKRAKAELAKVRRDQRSQLRAEQNRHKYMMGGCVVKYFPDGLEAYDFSEQEMNRIIACAFSLKDVKNMIATVVKERPDPEEEMAETEVENDDIDTDESVGNDYEEGEDDEDGDA